MPRQAVRAKLAVRHILGSAPLRAVPCVPSDVGVRTELIAPYPPSDGAALFVIETDSISLIGPSLTECHSYLTLFLGSPGSPPLVHPRCSPDPASSAV